VALASSATAVGLVAPPGSKVQVLKLLLELRQHLVRGQVPLRLLLRFAGLGGAFFSGSTAASSRAAWAQEEVGIMTQGIKMPGAETHKSETVASSSLGMGGGGIKACVQPQG